MIRKLVFIAFFTIAGLGKLSAQETTFGATAGFHNFTISASGGEITASSSSQGYFVGLFAEFNVSDKFNVQPEVHFASVFEEGETLNELIIPIMAKYYVSDEFSIQAGPQLDFLIEDDAEGINKFGVGVAIGAGYDFTEKLFVSSRYSFGLSNRIENAPSGISSRFDTFQIGLGYRF